jgi:hypothetical protein
MNQPGKADKNYKKLCKIRSLFDKINNACTKVYSLPEYLILKEGTVYSSKQNVISHIHAHIYTEWIQNRLQNMEELIKIQNTQGSVKFKTPLSQTFH